MTVPALRPALAGALGLVLLGGVAALAAEGPPAPPTDGCTTFADPKGDASIVLQAGAPGTPNDPDLDITGLVLQSTPEAFNAFVRVDKLGTRATYQPGHSFYVIFTLNKKIVSLIGTAYDPSAIKTAIDTVAGATAGTPAQRSPATRMLVDGTYTPSSLTATFDTKASLVTLSIKREDLAKVAGGSFDDGTVLTKVVSRSLAANPAVGLFFDSTAKDNAATTTDNEAWTVGDNACFGPPAPAVALLSSVGAVAGQFGDTVAVAAKRVDASGAPLAGEPVTFTVGSASATATTGSDGVAKAALTLKDKAGSTTLAIVSGDQKVSVPFTIALEKTLLKASGAKGTVTATLTDDDRTAVPGQTVVFGSGSKKVLVKTDGKGVAKASGFPANANVKVTYAGAPGMYLGASTASKA